MSIIGETFVLGALLLAQARNVLEAWVTIFTMIERRMNIPKGPEGITCSHRFQ